MEWIIAVSHRCSDQRLPRDGHQQHTETSWQDSATQRYPAKQVKEVLKAFWGQLMLRGVACTLEVGEAVEEEDAVTTASREDNTKKCWTESQNNVRNQMVLRKHVKKR